MVIFNKVAARLFGEAVMSELLIYIYIFFSIRTYIISFIVPSIVYRYRKHIRDACEFVELSIIVYYKFNSQKSNVLNLNT